MDPVLVGLRTALAGRYEVEHELGRGGMAVVYLARDLRHGRRVALKVLRSDLGLSSASDRFLLEIKTAARLDHPHILTLFDSGTAGGELFYVMPYVDGESLRQRLEREGALPLEQALQIAREVAGALDYAHRQGIIHRDIKPENILLSAGHARVADFGIARAVDVAGGKLTDTGLAIGTPMYMSPEQALADPALDGRADQYALGCVLYEMLAGAPPFTGPTSQAIMARQTADDVPPLTTVRDVPESLDLAVRRSLAKRAADRWPSAGEFRAALDVAAPRGLAVTRTGTWSRRRRLGVGAVVGAAGLALLLLGLWVGSAGRVEATAAPVMSVAVLPASFSGDTSQALLADGLTEGLITGLVRVPGVSVPASNRVRQFQAGSIDPRDAGSELGVDAVLTTDVQILGNRMRVTAQLSRVSDGVILWTDRFYGDVERDGEIADVFSIQDEFATRLVGALGQHLTAGSPGIAERGKRTANPEAYDLYLQARRLNAFAGAVSAEVGPRLLADSVVRLLREAVRLDSTFSDAWADLADAVLWRVGFGGQISSDAAVEARYAVDRAIELDSMNAAAYWVRGALRMDHDWNWDGAGADVRRAVEIAPSSADAALGYAVYLNFVNEHDSAVTFMRRAVSLDPQNSFMLANLGTRYAFAGMRDSALAASSRAIAIDSAQWVAYWVQMNVLLGLGRRAEADSAAERYVRLSDDGPGTIALVANYRRRTGDIAAARTLLRALTLRAQRDYVPYAAIGTVRLAVGDTAGALDALEASVRARELSLVVTLVLSYSPLRGTPRYDAILKRVYGDRPVPQNPFP